MARFLRQSSAATIKMGPFVSPTDGITPYTTAIPAAAQKLSANGGALGATHAAAASTHDADGYHAISLDATDTGTVGRLRIEVPGSAGNYLPAWDDFVVLAQAVYDVLFGTVAPSTLGGVAQTGDSFALANGPNGFVAIKGNTTAIAGKLPTNNIADQTLVLAAIAGIPGGGSGGGGTVDLPPAAVSASPAPTTTSFTATGTNLYASSGGYTSAPQQVRFKSGVLIGQRFAITNHAVSGSNHAFTVAAMPAAPAAGDTFDIL